MRLDVVTNAMLSLFQILFLNLLSATDGSRYKHLLKSVKRLVRLKYRCLRVIVLKRERRKGKLRFKLHHG